MIKTVITFNDGKILIHEDNVKESSKVFESGFYQANVTERGLSIRTVDVPEQHTPLPIKKFKNIFDYMKKFYNPVLKEKVNKLGFKHKLGILLYGIPGTGKTSFCTFLSNYIVSNYDGICLIAEDKLSLAGALSLASSIREIQDSPIVIFADEFERWAEALESEMKNFLDGINSIDNCIVLACTNYIEHIPDSLKKRPSRFKGVFEIKGIKDSKVIKSILKSKSEILDLFEEDYLDELSKKLVKERPTLDNLKNILLDQILDSELGKTTNKTTIGYNNGVVEDDDSNGFYFGSLFEDFSVESNTSNI